MSTYAERLSHALDDVIAERDRLRSVNGKLLEALKVVPEPEEEGFCSCCGRLELKLVGEAYKWQHSASCWYFIIRAAIKAAEEQA